MGTFRFDVNQWRRCYTLDDLTPPPGTPVRLAVDPSYKATDSSDHTGLAVGYVSEDYPVLNQEGSPSKLLTVLDAVSDRFQGIALPRTIVSLVQKYSVTDIVIEDPANGAYDLLHDVLVLLLEPLGLNPSITGFSPRKRPTLEFHSKALRIMDLQPLVENNPPLIRFKAGAYIDHLFDQVEKFVPEKKDNCTREDALLDAIAFLGNIR